LGRKQARVALSLAGNDGVVQRAHVVGARVEHRSAVLSGKLLMR
jgi:hypothetical protein